MSKFGSKQLIPLGTSALAIVWIVVGLKNYGFWEPVKGPTPGFVPAIVAWGMLAVSILAFLQSFKEGKPDYPAANWMAVLAGFSIFAGSFLIGMLPALAVYVLVWLRVIEKTPWKTTLITFAVIMAIVYSVFVLWLGVLFPQGLLFDLLLG